MKQKFFKKNLLILLFLFAIGFIVHFKSFQMIPFGDDWKFIYNYYTHEEKELNFSNYPGIFSYLAPYGPAILSIGLLHQVFGKTYFVYYLIPLIFKILTTFFLFLTLQNISHSLKQNSKLTNFLSAVLFLVGLTGIQAIDWSMNMNVYIALCIFSLGLFFQSKYYKDKIFLDLVISFLLLVFSIIVAPTRLTPLIVILPLIDLVMVVKKEFRIYKIFVLKNIFFSILVYIFLQIGIFGNPGQMNNSTLITPFIHTFLIDPILSFGIFMHWIGITILPIYPSSDIYKTVLTGALFVILVILAFYRSRDKWLIIGSIIYFISLFLMWVSSSLLRIEDSVSRHLIVPFFGLCFLIGIILMSKGKTISILKILLLVLILFHTYSVSNIYSYWISIGRGSDFIIPVQEKIMNHFPIPINSPRIIYLDFDDAAPLQSVVFGLAYRVAVLSGTRNINYLPRLFSDKMTLIKAIKEDISIGKQREEIVDSISAFQLRNKVFTDISPSLQNELREELKNPN